jgi:hypothetical protein
MVLKGLRKRFTSSTGEIDQARLKGHFDPLGGRIADAVPRTRVAITGEIQALRVVPRAGSPSLEVTVGDGTGRAVAIFTGRRRIGGFAPGRAVLLEGMAGLHRGRLQLMNPAYTLLA